MAHRTIILVGILCLALTQCESPSKPQKSEPPAPFPYATYFEGLETDIAYVQKRDSVGKVFIYMDKATQTEDVIGQITLLHDPTSIQYSRQGNFLTFVDRENLLIYSEPGPLMLYDFTYQRYKRLTDKNYFSCDLSPDGTTYLASWGTSGQDFESGGLVVYDSHTGLQVSVTEYVGRRFAPDSLEPWPSRPASYHWWSASQFRVTYALRDLAHGTGQSVTLLCTWDGSAITSDSILGVPHHITYNASQTIGYYYADQAQTSTHQFFIVKTQTGDTLQPTVPGRVMQAKFSPEETQLLLRVHIPGELLSSRYYIYDIEAKSATQVFPDATRVEHATFTPSGTQIIGRTYLSEPDYHGYYIFAINTDNSNPAILSNLESFSYAPVLVPRE